MYSADFPALARHPQWGVGVGNGCNKQLTAVFCKVLLKTKHGGGGGGGVKMGN